MRELMVRELSLVSGGADEVSNCDETSVQEPVIVTGTKGGGSSGGFGGFGGFGFGFGDPFGLPAGDVPPIFGFGGGGGIPAGEPSEPAQEESEDEMPTDDTGDQEFFIAENGQVFESREACLQTASDNLSSAQEAAMLGGITAGFVNGAGGQGNGILIDTFLGLVGGTAAAVGLAIVTASPEQQCPAG